MTNAWARVQRQQLDVRAVGDRAAGRTRREVPDARAGGRADDDDGRLRASTPGPPSRWSRSRWRSAGTIAGGSGWPRTSTTSRANGGFSNAGNSRILILEDTDRDGVADSRKVFMEGIVFPSAIAVGFDGVFVGAPPNLLFVPDRDGDDKADVADIEVRLTGWGIRDRHETSEQPALGTGRLAVRTAGLRDAVEGQKAGRQGPALQTQRAVSRGHPEGRRRRHQRRRLALPPDERRVRGRRARLQQPVGHRLRRQGPAAHQRLRDPAPLARHPRRHLPAPGRPALQSVRLQRHPDHRRSPASLGARRRARLPVRRVSRSRSRAGSSWPTSTSTRCSRTCSCRKGSGFTARHGDDFLHGEQRPVDRLQPGDRPGRRALRARLARRRHLRAWTCCTRRRDGSSGSRRSSRSPSSWRAATPICGTMTDAQLVELQTSRSDWHARRARVILQDRAAKRHAEGGDARAAAPHVHVRREPGLCACARCGRCT